ncbi:MAG TPA: bifunctional DNA-formamidopyrimidine glycosylase/DNA-(apurinic or apyrimidinic site) lyase [Acidimicrobiales bacterium]|nr:bifunctional DNA-formamidopyrimidine glycosylase/DNA-(apurinic or apyrimidinic site) lyase [Acidimicrobiales bacterium]
MPELPEVETIRRDLEKEVAGKKIKEVEATGVRTIRRHKSKKDFVSRLEGRKIMGIQRRGKYLLLKLEPQAPPGSAGAGAPKQSDVLVVHLGMSGQLLRAKSAKEPLPKHTHVVVTFTQGGQLRYVDPRTFGELFVTAADDLEDAVPELAHLGFDPLEDVMSWNRFGDLLNARKVKLKQLLMDQKFIAGIGNMYADEILWAAGLRYDRDSDSLSSQEVRRLYRSMVETLQEAIKHRGSSLADEQYRDLFGEVGDFQSQHKVYDREGEACRRCRNPIVRVKWQGRSTFLCEQCQV